MRRLGFLFFLLIPLQGHGENAEPVERLHAALLEAMQIEEHDAREAHLQPVIADTFDARRIAGISLGRTWRSLDETQQGECVSLLMELVIATYADRFDSYNNQQFETIAVETVKTGHVVKTQLLRVDDVPVSLDYYLRNDGVFNVVADGVSDLSLRRADYNSIIKQQGFDALMRHVAEKIDEARAQVAE